MEIIANPYLQLGFHDPEVIRGRWVVLSFPNEAEQEPVDTWALSQWIYLKFRPPYFRTTLNITYTNAKKSSEHTCNLYVFPWDDYEAINEFLSLLQVEYPMMELKVVDSEIR